MKSSGLIPVKIAGTGSYVPERVLTNKDLEGMVETSDEWILTRTGIRERHVAAEDQATSDLAYEAAVRALSAAGVSPGEIDLVLVATVTPDMAFPSTACWVQRKLGCVHAAAMDLAAACSGFLYALSVGKQFIATGAAKHVLIIGAEKLTSIVDWKDRNTCVLFGDAAGAVVLSPSETQECIHYVHMGADGRQSEILKLPGGGSRHPVSEETLKQGMHCIRMAGKEVFKLAVTVMQEAALHALDKSGIGADRIDCVIPHQANTRIIHALADRLEFPIEKVVVNVDRYGNTSAATIPLALDESVRSGRVKRGDNILMVAFGGGLTWASAVVTY